MKRLSPEQKEQLIRLQKKRERKRQKRSRRRRQGLHRARWAPTKEPSRMLQFLGASGFVDRPHLQPLQGHRYFIQIPKVFSLIDNPDETLETLENVAQAARDPNTKELHFDHSHCEEMDMGASTVMDVIIMAARRNWKRGEIMMRGQYPKLTQVAEILKVSGLLKHIQHPDSRLPPSLMAKYKPFDLVSATKVKVRAYLSTPSELTTTRLTLYFDDLLRDKGYSLTDLGKNYLSRLISEVIDNAEQHSGQNEWFLIGYMSQISAKLGVCNIAIFDFGDSIYTTISGALLNEALIGRIGRLIDRHTERGFFQFREKWAAENLWTLFALQEGISRFNVKDSISDRGHGTVNMIDFFLTLGKSVDPALPPKMALLSEKTYILFDGKYELHKKDVGGETRQIIAFNKSNSLQEKPDDKYVKNLKNRFPGTMITMKFYLDDEYLQLLSASGGSNARDGN